MVTFLDLKKISELKSAIVIVKKRDSKIRVPVFYIISFTSNSGKFTSSIVISQVPNSYEYD